MSIHARDSLPRPRSRARRPAPKALEARVAPASAFPLGAMPTVALVGETLTVEGTPGPDRIVIVPSGTSGAVRVLANGRVSERLGPVGAIRIDGGAGDDLLVVGGRVAAPSRINGGDGDDRIRGGLGADLIDGGAGDDLVFGSPGRDALETGPGLNRLHVPQSLGAIRVGPSAGGAAFRSLSRGYTLRPIGDSATADPGPLVVGASDLADPAIVALLQRSYGAGHPVALTNANADEAEVLRGLLEHRGGTGMAVGVDRADLVTFQRALRADGRPHSSTGVLFPRQEAAATDGSRLGTALGRFRSEQARLEWLTARFSATPIVPETMPVDSSSSPLAATSVVASAGDGVPPELTTIAESLSTSSQGADSLGNSVLNEITAWAARSFVNGEDIYYVQQTTENQAVLGYAMNGFPYGANTWTNIAASSLTPQTPTLLGSSPQSTSVTETLTRGVSFTIGGSVGWNQTQGLNASVSGGLTISNSTTYPVPPVDVTNQSNLITGVPEWSYDINLTDFEKANPGALHDTANFEFDWVWSVPFSSYTSGQDAVTITAGASESFNYGTFGDGPPTQLNVATQGQLEMPLPFGNTFALQEPVVQGLDQTVVRPGNTFTIQGEGLYPALITSVLIGGTPLTTSQYTTVSDTMIQVVAPNQPGRSQPVVVQTSEGLSNADRTITIR